MTERLPIRGEGELLEKLDNGLFRIRMANGYLADAHLDKRVRNSGAQFTPGERLLVEFSPYNMNQARILGLPGG